MIQLGKHRPMRWSDSRLEDRLFGIRGGYAWESFLTRNIRYGCQVKMMMGCKVLMVESGERCPTAGSEDRGKGRDPRRARLLCRS
jgi:hypothetical protein